MEVKIDWIKELRLDVSLLPIEKKHEVPKELIIDFKTRKERMADKKNRDYFNDLNQQIVREAENSNVRVAHNDDLIEKFNKYRYNDIPNDLTGCLWAIGTLGLYYVANRRVIKDGCFGHFNSAGRHMLCKAGITAQLPFRNSWASPNEIPTDMEFGDKGVVTCKRLGSKTILTVQENCIAGAYRIGTREDDKNSQDGQFVIFSQGRYILQCTEYGMLTGKNAKRKVFVKDLVKDRQNNIVKLGPMSICFIKEGYIGGAYHILTGKYLILNPGPPYILHEKDYEKIEIRKREGKQFDFNLGPLQIRTIKDGYIGGAYSKHNGKFIILPPGNSYVLNKRDYELIDIQVRKERFKLGPYTFLTVKEYMLAGVYEKKGGRFVLLTPGYTYQLSREDYEEPIMVKNNKHRVDIGPLTYLTLEDGTLSGAYRVKDGSFEEFTDNSVEHLLHSTEYHSIITIPKYSYKMQKFGPYKVITIPEGVYGVFMNEGKIEIVSPGYYKLEWTYEILPSIPKVIKTTPFTKISFIAKDGVKMTVDATLIWQVNHVPAEEVSDENPDGVKQMALYPGGYHRLLTDLEQRFKLFVCQYSKQFNRSRLLPTQQDVLIRARLIDQNIKEDEEPVDQKEMLEEDTKISQAIRFQVQKDVLSALQKASASCSWGINFKAVKIQQYELDDMTIGGSLKEITRIAIEKHLVNVTGDLNVAIAEARRLAEIKRQEGTSEAKHQTAIATAAVNTIKAETDAYVSETTLKARKEVLVLNAEASSKMKVLETTSLAEADAKRREILLEISNSEILEQARAQKTATEVVAEANYQDKLRQNEAAGFMTDKQYELAVISKSTNAMAKMGDSAWRMPDKYMKFYDHFAPMVKIPKS